MAKIIGHNPTQTNEYAELNEKVKLQNEVIEELIKLNQGYEEEIKRIVNQYDKLYEEYMKIKPIGELTESTQTSTYLTLGL